MDKPIKIVHTETGDEGTCMPSALHVWQDHGWTAVEDESSEGTEVQVIQQGQPAPAGQPLVAQPVPGSPAAKVQQDPNRSKE